MVEGGGNDARARGGGVLGDKVQDDTGPEGESMRGRRLGMSGLAGENDIFVRRVSRGQPKPNAGGEPRPPA